MSDNETYLNIICPVCGGSAVKTKTHSIDRIYIYCGACGFQYNSAQKEKRDPKKVYIVWAKGDIADLRPDWTEKKCQKALEAIGCDLQSRSIEQGWEVIEILLAQYEADGKK